MTEFDVGAMYAAMDGQRVAMGLSWPKVAAAMWNQSAVLNERRRDHPISPATLTGIAKRHDCTCQHALFVLRWLKRVPEDFLTASPAPGTHVPLPDAAADRRLRWDLAAVFNAMDARRRERGLIWRELAQVLRCSEHQLTGIRTARYAIGMKLMMRIVQWLEQPAAAFIYPARW